MKQCKIDGKFSDKKNIFRPAEIYGGQLPATTQLLMADWLDYWYSLLWYRNGNRRDDNSLEIDNRVAGKTYKQMTTEIAVSII